MAARARASNTRLQRTGKARCTVRHTAPAPLSRQTLAGRHSFRAQILHSLTVLAR
jgi:hypothetical protein